MADQVKLRKRLEAMLKLPENQICADCTKRGPRWASANLGVFVCIECSGIHRNLGVHISFVRSVNLDTWTTKQVQFMEDWGNGRAKEYYEANLPRDYLRPKENDSVRVVERFIRDKYEHKKFVSRTVPTKVDRSAEEEEVETPAPKSRTSSKSSVAKSVTPVVAKMPTPTPPAPIQELNLLDLSEPEPAPVLATAPEPVYQNGFGQSQTQPQSSFGQSFMDFGTAPAFPTANNFGNQTSGQPAAVDPFFTQPPMPPQHQNPNIQMPLQQQQQQPQYAGNSQIPPEMQQQQMQQQQQPPKQSADAILSLYNAVPISAAMGTGPFHGGMGMPMMGGGGAGGMGMHHLPQMQHQPYQQGYGGFPPVQQQQQQQSPGYGGFPQQNQSQQPQQVFGAPQHHQQQGGYGGPSQGQPQQQGYGGFPPATATPPQQMQMQMGYAPNQTQGPSTGLGMGMGMTHMGAPNPMASQQFGAPAMGIGMGMQPQGQGQGLYGIPQNQPQPGYGMPGMQQMPGQYPASGFPNYGQR
eukprot:gene12799-26983_t